MTKLQKITKLSNLLKEQEHLLNEANTNPQISKILDKYTNLNKYIVIYHKDAARAWTRVTDEINKTSNGIVDQIAKLEEFTDSIGSQADIKIISDKLKQYAQETASQIIDTKETIKDLNDAVKELTARKAKLADFITALKGIKL